MVKVHHVDLYKSDDEMGKCVVRRCGGAVVRWFCLRCRAAGAGAHDERRQLGKPCMEKARKVPWNGGRSRGRAKEAPGWNNIDPVHPASMSFFNTSTAPRYLGTYCRFLGSLSKHPDA